MVYTIISFFGLFTNDSFLTVVVFSNLLHMCSHLSLPRQFICARSLQIDCAYIAIFFDKLGRQLILRQLGRVQLLLLLL